MNAKDQLFDDIIAKRKDGYTWEQYYLYSRRLAYVVVYRKDKTHDLLVVSREFDSNGNVLRQEERNFTNRHMAYQYYFEIWS